jgi:hypothetical protein
MCGPSGNEILAQQQEASLSTMLQNVYQDRFASQTATLQELNTQLQQLATGQTPQGFSAAEMATLNTRALNVNAAQTRAAEQAVSNAIAGQGGGAANPAGLTSGVQEAVRGNIAATGAANTANALENIQLESAQVGRENLIRAISGNQALAGLESPLPYAEAASGATEASFGMAKTINQQKNQWAADLAGVVTGIGGSAVKAGLGLLGGGGGGDNYPQNPSAEDIAT